MFLTLHRSKIDRAKVYRESRVEKSASLRVGGSCCFGLLVSETFVGSSREIGKSNFLFLCEDCHKLLYDSSVSGVEFWIRDSSILMGGGLPV